MATRTIGLDIGTSHARAIEVEFSGKGPSAGGTATVVAFAEAPLLPGSFGDGEVLEIQAVATVLKQLWDKGGFSSKNVVLGVGNQRVVVREMEVPSYPMTELRQSLAFQVAELLPMSVDEAILDFYPTSEFAGESGGARMLRGIMVAAAKQTVSSLVLAVETAGLVPKHVDLNAFALLRAQMAGAFMQQTVAFVDVGARTTNVIVAAEGVPRFVRSLPMGGQDSTDAVSSAMQIGVQEAENLKREVGIGFSVPEDRKLAADALATTSRTLVEAVRNTFVYYSGNNPGAAIQHVSLTGGGAHLPGLGQFLSSSSRLPVSYGDGLSRVRLGKKVSAEQMKAISAMLPVCTGLAFAEVAS